MCNIQTLKVIGDDKASALFTRETQNENVGDAERFHNYDEHIFLCKTLKINSRISDTHIIIFPLVMEFPFPYAPEIIQYVIRFIRLPFTVPIVIDKLKLSGFRYIKQLTNG